jgi:cellulose biosynthesis protein BcsQ
VICTFYSYKGGVGRSMALANAAHMFARAGLRVLMIDFDLEAPGLEQYFPVDQASIRAHAGLFDLISRYKVAMARSLPGAPEDQDFRRLESLFIVSIYPQLPSGGKLDLMPAGRRGNDEQLSEYALALRQFDWQDFYFNFGGEVFFEWLRKSLDRNLYDLVLVDSRTGVTEMGGICAYQLADAIVVMCATNQQNLDGTHDVVRNFFSPRVIMLRAGRVLQLLVVPSRIETRDADALADFRTRFEGLFAGYTPKELTAAGLNFWDLMIPYEPRSAFQERVNAQDDSGSARSSIAPAMRQMVRALALLADRGEPVSRLAAEDERAARIAEPQYDITTRSAGFDVFLAYRNTDAKEVASLARELEQHGVRTFFADPHLSAGPNFQSLQRAALRESGVCAVVVGPSADYPWQSEQLRELLEDKERGTSLRFIPVLLPGAALPPNDVVPTFLAGLEWLRLEAVEDDGAVARLADAIRSDRGGKRATTERVSSGAPYKGLAPFEEADAEIFFGRHDLVERMLQSFTKSHFLAVVGPSGVGKTSVVCAGVIPELRRGAISGSDRWNFIVMRPGAYPVRSLLEALADVIPSTERRPPIESADIAALDRVLGASEARYLVVVDQLEELFMFSERDDGSRFIQLILDIIALYKHRISLILVLRSDYLAQALEVSSDWAGLFERDVAFVRPLTRDEMRQAIVGPAQSAGLAIEPGLVELIVNDAVGAAGALPLVQYVLRSLWERSRKGYLTVEAYREVGGVAGSLAGDAEAFYRRLDPEHRGVARAILLRLVSAMPDGTFVRRVATVAELSGAGQESIARHVLDALVAARLAVVSSGQGSDALVELAHEAIIRAWPRFQEWIGDEREFLRQRTRLGAAATRWQETGKQAEFLYPEGEVRQLSSQGLPERWSSLSEGEREFITASERALLRQRRRVRLVRSGFIAAGLVIVASGIYATFQAWQATQQRMIALEKAEVARQQLALAQLANQRAVSTIAPDGQRMVRIGYDGVSLVDLATGRDIGRIRGLQGEVDATAFSPDGRLLAISAADDVRIYDSETLRLLMVLKGHTDVIRRLAISPDGLRIASGSDDGTARIWSLATGQQIGPSVQADGPVVGLAFSPDGARLTVSSQSGTLYVVNMRTGEILR